MRTDARVMDEQRVSRGVNCPTCGKQWPASVDTCPDDGTYMFERTMDGLDATIATPPKPSALWELSVTNPELETTIRDREEEVQGARRSSPELMPGRQVGDYVIDKKIGEGSMGEVYLAVHPEIGRRVAVKVIGARVFEDPEAIERFIREARAMAELHHPGIAQVFGFGRFDDGRVYLIMEWLRGQNLGQRLMKGKIEREEALDIIMQTAAALRAAHEQGIIHRDLKPENVFLQDISGENPLVKILDFGLAKRTAEQSEDRTTTQIGQMIGTPIYMSPEQCRGKLIDHRTDIYALGCMSYQLLVGRPPFVADSVAEVIAAHLTEPPPRPQQLGEMPHVLDKLLYAMVAKEPQKRPSLPDIRHEIQRVLGIQTGSMPAVRPSPVPIPAPSDSDPGPLSDTVLANPLPRKRLPTPQPPRRESDRAMTQVVRPLQMPHEPRWTLLIVGVLIAIALLAVLVVTVA